MYNKRTLNKDTKASKEAKSIPTPRDIIYDPMGQWTNPYQPTRVPGSNMTMQGVPYAVLGIGSTGQQQMMYPGAEYMFPGSDYVDEYPMMQSGGAIVELTDEEIEEYRRGGYIVEELPKAQVGLNKRLTPQELINAQKAQQLQNKQAQYFKDNPVSPTDEFGNKLKVSGINAPIPTSMADAEGMIQRKEIIPESLASTRAKQARQAEERKQERIRLQEEYAKRQANPEYSSWTGLPGESWRETLAAEGAPMEAMFRFSNEDNFFDDYINPAAWIGYMAKSLGEAPLQAKKTDSYLPYVTSIGMPLLGGAAAGIGAKTTGQFINNAVNPFAGMGDYLTTQTPLKNTWKLNPLAPKLGQYNRVVGQDAIDDIMQSGLVRVQDKAGVAIDLGPFGIVNRTTPYPSFAKAKPQQQYINQVVSQGKTPYVISTDRPMKASNLARHGKGKTQFPINDEGKYISGFPASEAQVYEATPHWLRGYKPIEVEELIPVFRAAKPGQLDETLNFLRVEKKAKELGVESLTVKELEALYNFRNLNNESMAGTGYGQGFTSDISDIGYYGSPRIRKTRGYTEEPELFRTYLTKTEADKYNATKFKDYATAAQNREFLLPLDKLENVERFKFSDYDRLTDELIKFKKAINPNYKQGGSIPKFQTAGQKYPNLFNFDPTPEYVGYQGRVPVAESTRVANTYKPTQQEIKATKEYAQQVGSTAQAIRNKTGVSQKKAMQQAEQALQANSRIQPEAKAYANTKQAQERDAYVFDEGMNARDYFRYPLQFLAGRTPTEEERIQDRIRITDPRTSNWDKFMGTVGEAMGLAPEALINTGVGLAFAPSNFTKLGMVADAVSPIGNPFHPDFIKSVNQAGEYLTTQTPLKYGYKLNPKALKDKDVEILQRWHFDNQYNKYLPSGTLDPKYTGRFYTSNWDNSINKKRLNTGVPGYMHIRPGSGEIRTAIVRKGSANLPQELLTGPGSKDIVFDNIERILPENIPYTTKRIEKNPFDKIDIMTEDGDINPDYIKARDEMLKIAQAEEPKPHWWKGYELPETPTSLFNTRAQNDLLVEQARISGEAPLPSYMEPYISRRYTPAAKEQDIFESFLSPEKQAELRKLRTQTFTPKNQYKQGGIVLELDENQIQKYLDGGYIVEELQSYQEGSEVISEYGWDYKKEGDKYLTKPSASNDWIVATGKPLEAIKQKIYKETPYTKEDKKSDYITNVERLINKGYSLEDLVEKRIGTKAGLSELFPDLVKKEDKEKVKKEPEVVVKSWDKNNNGIPDRVEEEPAEEIKETYSVTDAYGSKSQKQSSPLNYRDKVKEIAKSKSEEVSLKPTILPEITSWQDVFTSTANELPLPVAKEKEYNLPFIRSQNQYLDNFIELESPQKISQRPTILPNVPAWQDYTQGINEGLSTPEYIEAELDDNEIKELEAQGYTIEEVSQPEPWINNLQNNISQQNLYNETNTTLDPFGRKPVYGPSEEKMLKLQDFMKSAEDKGLKKWEPESPFSLGDIAGTGSITDLTEGVTDLVNLGQTYLQRQSDKNNTESEAKTKSISELKAKNFETTNEDLETYTNSNPITMGENIEIKSKKYNPTGRRIYRQELIDLDNTKFGFRNRGEMQEIISKGGSVTSFYPFETKKDIERKNKYPNNATFVGIDTEGSFKTGKLEDFKNTDRVARVFTNLVDEFILEENGSVKLELRNDDNPSSPVPVVTVIEKDENGKEIKKEGSINVLTKFVKDSRNQFGPIQGGRVILKGSDGKSVLVSGSLNNIYEQFKEIRERTGKPVEIVQLDNGSYNLGLATKDNKMTSKDLAAYDNLNTSGGNFLYIIDEPLNNESKSSITQEQKDAAYTTVNNLRKFVAKTSENIPYIKDVLGDIDITKNIPDYSRFVKSPTADNFREDIIIPDYKYGMSTDDLLKEKGYMGKGIGSDPYIDCSGAVCRVMTSLGKDLGNPLNTNAQKIHNKTKEIKDSSKWKDGDIITFNTEGSKIDHIGFLVIDENTGEKYIAESSRSFQEGRIVPFQQRLDYLYNVYPDMKYYIRRFDK